jgi:hypothetical protein
MPGAPPVGFDPRSVHSGLRSDPMNEERAMPAPDPDGQISLMLCESILHILVEEGVVSKDKALEAITGVVELARENDKIGRRRSASRSAVQLIEEIAHTFAL